MSQIIIGSTVIDFPESAGNPNWADKVIQFAQAVESVLATLTGPFDVPQKIMDIDAYDIVGTTDLQNGELLTGQEVSDGVTPLAFPISVFPAEGTRACFIRYSVFRTSTIATKAEAGSIIAIFNGTTWSYHKDKVGDANITFGIDTSGQVKFATTSIGGLNHQGRITYVAQGLKQS